MSEGPGEKNASWWRSEDSRVVCELCPRECRIPEGKRGFCFVRQNIGGRMVLATYGKSTGFCIDPIEKKPLNHFLPGTAVLSFGTAGCNLGCKFCQNWDISKAKEIAVLSQAARPAEIAAAAADLDCRSVAFTYNDPVIWAEYAIDTAAAVHERGIKTVAVTAGYIQPRPREEFYAHIDAANVDLKAFTERFYKQLTGSSLAPVLETLEWLKRESRVWLELTTLLIPGENDSPGEIERMCSWIVETLGADVPLHLTAFHPDYRMLEKGSTPHKTLVRAREQALSCGIRYVYTGNVLDVERQSTFCPHCSALLIERRQYNIGEYRISDGGCAVCGAKIPGVFQHAKGTWGSRRRPIAIDEYSGQR